MLVSKPPIQNRARPRGLMIAALTFDVTRVKLSQGQFDGCERVANPRPFCSKCSDRGDSDLANGTVDGYDHEGSGSSLRRAN